MLPQNLTKIELFESSVKLPANFSNVFHIQSAPLSDALQYYLDNSVSFGSELNEASFLSPRCLPLVSCLLSHSLMNRFAGVVGQLVAWEI